MEILRALSRQRRKCTGHPALPVESMTPRADLTHDARRLTLLDGNGTEGERATTVGVKLRQPAKKRNGGPHPVIPPRVRPGRHAGEFDAVLDE